MSDLATTFHYQARAARIASERVARAEEFLKEAIKLMSDPVFFSGDDFSTGELDTALAAISQQRRDLEDLAAHFFRKARVS